MSKKSHPGDGGHGLGAKGGFSEEYRGLRGLATRLARLTKVQTTK
ncbi:hypothetical protein ACIHFE_34455 [Streptomyces sp. NPDC052396]